MRRYFTAARRPANGQAERQVLRKQKGRAMFSGRDGLIGIVALGLTLSGCRGPGIRPGAMSDGNTSAVAAPLAVPPPPTPIGALPSAGGFSNPNANNAVPAKAAAPQPPDPPTVVPTAAPASVVRGIQPVAAESPVEPAKPTPARIEGANSVPDAGLAQCRLVQAQAQQRYVSIDTYIARLRRREQVNGKEKPEELVLFKFRKQPWSVYFKWLGSEGAGREVVYVKGQYNDQMHTLLAAGDMPFMPAGKRMALSPDNVFVRAASRHTIAEAGIGHVVEQYGQVLAGLQRGDKRFGTVRYLGLQKRPEYDVLMEAVEQTLPPGYETPLPHGGLRRLYFDPTTKLPVILLTYDHNGREVEYYCYDRLQLGVGLADDEFNPDLLWGKQDSANKSPSTKQVR
jgi:hypothetical protein